ncbi:NUDIX hydrolase [Sporichthya brevicatena]|uniref:NUDIX hydrolase n=1 Tax=Sporichthya brevicatena TaxID=171442 RepID=A0ABN1H3V5_9ACTN
MIDDPDDWSRPRVAAGVLFFDPDGRVLVVKPTYKDAWDVPGGYVNVDETPREAAVREVKEELGLDVALGAALVVDWAPHPAEGDKVLFLFDGGTLDTAAAGNIRLAPDELSEFRFTDRADVADLLIERLARRVTAAVTAHDRGTTEYLERGVGTE